MKQTTLHIPEEMYSLIGDLEDETVTTDDVPKMSRAEVMRSLLRYAVENADLAALIPEHRRVLYQRERFKEGEAKLRNLRTGFETRVKRHFTRRFKNGYSADQLAEFAINMRTEAEILFPDDDDRRKECISYVEAVTQQATTAVEESEFDPLDPEEMFAGFSGVQEAREGGDGDVQELRFESMVDFAAEQYASDVPTRSINSMLRRRYDATSAEAQDVLSEARDR